MGGAYSRVLAYIARPTSSPYVGKQLTTLFHAHTATVEATSLGDAHIVHIYMRATDI